MRFILILILLKMVCYNSIKMNPKTTPLIKITNEKPQLFSIEHIKEHEGKDFKNEDEEINNELLQKINDDMTRRKILRTLENQDYSKEHKLELINKYKYLISIGEYVNNLYAGGLMHEFDMYFDL